MLAGRSIQGANSLGCVIPPQIQSPFVEDFLKHTASIKVSWTGSRL